MKTPVSLFHFSFFFLLFITIQMPCSLAGRGKDKDKVEVEFEFKYPAASSDPTPSTAAFNPAAAASGMDLDTPRIHESKNPKEMLLRNADYIFKMIATSKQIPYQNDDSECDSNSHVASQILDSNKLINRKIWFVANRGFIRPKNNKNLRWNFHVATVVYDIYNDKEIPIVIDPKLADGPIFPEDWILLMDCFPSGDCLGPIVTPSYIYQKFDLLSWLYDPSYEPEEDEILENRNVALNSCQHYSEAK